MARGPDSGRGDAVRSWFRGLPRTTRRIVGAVVLIGVLALWYAVLLVWNAWLLEESDWTDPLPGMVGGLVGIGAVLWWQRRRMGGFRQLGEYERALRRGRLPEDADPAVWGPRLDGAQRMQRRARPLALGGSVVSVVVLVLVFASVDLGWVVLVATALVGLAVVAVVEVSSRRQSARIDRLRDQVGSSRAG